MGCPPFHPSDRSAVESSFHVKKSGIGMILLANYYQPIYCGFAALLCGKACLSGLFFLFSGYACDLRGTASQENRGIDGRKPKVFRIGKAAKPQNKSSPTASRAGRSTTFFFLNIRINRLPPFDFFRLVAWSGRDHLHCGNEALNDRFLIFLHDPERLPACHLIKLLMLNGGIKWRPSAV